MTSFHPDFYEREKLSLEDIEDLTDGGSSSLHYHSLDRFEATGIVSGGVPSLNADTTKVDISACTYTIQGVPYSYAGITGYSPALTGGQTARRLGLSSAGLVDQAGNFSDAQKQAILPLARIQALQGTSGPGATLIPPIDLRYVIGQEGYYERIWQEQVFGVLYAETGGGFTEYSTPLTISQAAGTAFDAQGKKITIPSTAQISAKQVYHVGGAWAVQTEATLVVPTTQYDNGTDLTILTDAHWTAHYLLRSPKNEDEFFLMIGQAEYTTQTAAEAAAVNYGPFINEATSGLYAVAKLIVRKNATSIYRVVSILPRIKGTTVRTTGISAQLPTVSNPIDVTNYEEAWAHFNSAGIVHRGVITDHGNGTFSIAYCEAVIRSGINHADPLVVYAIAAAGPLTPTDNDVSFYYINYNGGTPVWAVSTSHTPVNGMTEVLGLIVTRRGTRLWIIDVSQQTTDPGRKLSQRDLAWDGNIQSGFWHTKGGAALGASALALTLTAGQFYYGLVPVPNIAFDTSIAGTANANVFDYYYNRAAYAYIADSKNINNIQYDNAGVLSTLNPNKYRTDWVYLILDGAAPRLVVIMGITVHNSLAEAQGEGVPAVLPHILDGGAVLIGRVIVKRDAVVLDIATAFGNRFVGSNTSEHNSLAGLQGGTVGEYYHLTAAAYTDLTDGGDSILHYHATDRDRANHTGTQLLATISDAGDSASKNVGTGVGTVAAGDHNHAGIYEPADATILKGADIGINVQAYDADIATIAAFQAEMEAGTEVALRSMSPLRVAQAIAALGSKAAPKFPIACDTVDAAETLTIPATYQYIIAAKLNNNGTIMNSGRLHVL